MNSNYKYYKKYLKYKTKYLRLKEQNNLSNKLTYNENEYNQIGMGMIDSLKSFAGSNMGNMMSMAKNFASGNPSMLMGALPGNYQNLLVEYKQFITPQNMELFGKLIISTLSHLHDPTFYPMMAKIIKDITMLIGSVETAAIPMILFNLNKTLAELKVTFPNEFKLLKEFFVSNREKIIPILQKYSAFVNIQSYTFIIDFIFN